MIQQANPITAYPIFYSFRRCPYAMRARLALVVSNCVCELREVVLRDKPQEMLAVSPKGTVPVLTGNREWRMGNYKQRILCPTPYSLLPTPYSLLPTPLFFQIFTTLSHLC
jgi:glutaredoxin